MRFFDRYFGELMREKPNWKFLGRFILDLNLYREIKKNNIVFLSFLDHMEKYFNYIYKKKVKVVPMYNGGLDTNGECHLLIIEDKENIEKDKKIPYPPPNTKYKKV